MLQVRSCPVQNIDNAESCYPLLKGSTQTGSGIILFLYVQNLIETSQASILKLMPTTAALYEKHEQMKPFVLCAR